MLHDFYHQKKETDTQVEKMRLTKTAAQLIKNDIKSRVKDKDVYPPSNIDISNTNIATGYLPESLTVLLRMMFVVKGKDLGHATQPRVLQTSILLWLGVQIHFHFASRICIDSLAALGYSCFYSKVQSYKRGAAVTCCTDIPSRVI